MIVTKVGALVEGPDITRSPSEQDGLTPAGIRRGDDALVDACQQFARLGGRRADAMVLNANKLGEAAWAAAGYHRETDCARWVKPLR